MADAKLVEILREGAEVWNEYLQKNALGKPDLSGANLSWANLSEAECRETLFVNVRLADAKGPKWLKHYGPSVVDHRTLTLNPSLPLEFLRGCGLPNFIIDNRHVLYGDLIQFYSCFIRASTQTLPSAYTTICSGRGFAAGLPPKN